MTLALIRFVNSLLDPLQKRDKSLPLSVLAADAGLPTVFVEIRHWGTHENNLPGAEVLKDMGIRALEWLHRNFWNKHEPETDIAGWRSGAVDIKQVVGAFDKDRRASFEDLVVELAGNEDYAISRGIFDPLIAALDARILAFPADFIEYMVEILTTTSNGEYPWTSNANIRSFFRSIQVDTHSEISRNSYLVDHALSQSNGNPKLFKSAQLRQCRTTMHKSSKYTVYLHHTSLIPGPGTCYDGSWTRRDSYKNISHMTSSVGSQTGLVRRYRHLSLQTSMRSSRN
jgi:hypothetical protein